MESFPAFQRSGQNFERIRNSLLHPLPSVNIATTGEHMTFHTRSLVSGSNLFTWLEEYIGLNHVGNDCALGGGLETPAAYRLSVAAGAVTMLAIRTPCEFLILCYYFLFNLHVD